LQFKGGSLG
ncbi:uroporphyrinogen-III synthase HemD family protein, partial [Vibrio parahaemolyticus VP-48]